MKQRISKLYLEEQKNLHRNPSYGVASAGFAGVVADIIRKTRAKSVTDYGAGKKRLVGY